MVERLRAFELAAAVLLPLLLSGTVQAVAQPPTAVSVTPSSGSGSSQTFALLYSDGNGASDLNTAQLLINGSLTYVGACAPFYDVPSHAVYLNTDDGSSWMGGIPIGTAGSIQNSQCTVNVGASSAVASGNNLTVNLAFSFKPGFSGGNIYLLARDLEGLVSGWQNLGNWLTSAPVAPTAVSVTPNSGSGTSQTFALLYSDGNGASDLNTAQLLINGSLTYVGACAPFYDVPSHAVYLNTDDGSSWMGGIPIGTAGSIQNSQCTVNVGASSAVASGNNLTVNLAFSFKPGFSGGNIYLLARDLEGLVSGWQNLGNWLTSAPVAPTAVSVTPNSGSGTSQTFALLYSDGNGSNDLKTTQVLIGSSLTYAGTCAPFYDVPSHAVYLDTDDGSSWMGGIPIGTAGTIQNSQCTVNVGASSAVASGNNLTVNLAFSFKPGFSGGNIYLLARDLEGLVSGWQNLGNWNVPTAQPPTITNANSATFTVGAAGSFTVTATGSPAPTFSESGALPSGVTLTAGGSLSGTPGAGTAATYPIVITALNGVGTNATQNFTLTINNPTPSITSISPPSVNAGAPNTTLTVAGSGFIQQSVVHANGTGLATVFGNAAQLTVTMPAAMMVNAGTLSITVNNPAPGGGASGAANFKIWPGYPRANAGSVLRSPPPLPLIPVRGTLESVLDWTAKDSDGSQEDVLATDHSLAPMGIPNIDTTDLTTATGNPFVAVAGSLNVSSRLSMTEISSLVSYVQGGGTLYLWRPSVTGLLTSLGIAGSNSHSGVVLRPLTFDVTKVDSLLRYIDNPVEVNWQLNVPLSATTRGYLPGSCTVLASWSTGDAAVLNCSMGKGRAYVFGWRLSHILTEAERVIVPGIEPNNTNQLVLDADICRLLMRGSYEGFAANPQVRVFAPGGHHAALIITHDVDATTSYSFVPEFANLETSLSFNSTFTFNTNPYDTGWLAAHYIAPRMDNIQYALNLGFDAEDHSFSHAPDFATAAFGTGKETAGNYMPMYSTTTASTSGMSVIGELGVSRWLLEKDFGITVSTFRAGYLDIPANFPQGLTETGYQRDTSYAGGLTRGSFPYVLSTVNNGIVTSYPVMEYPLAISDRNLTTTSESQIVSEWTTVIQGNYANNAPTVLLLHPSNDTLKIQALQDLLAAVSGLDLWIGDLKTFSTFWESQGVTSQSAPANVTLSISPQTVTLFSGTTQQFTATVTGTTNQDVTWWVNGVTGGNATVGTIDATGFYTAPAVAPSPSTVTITAISAADPTRTANASVTF